MSIIDNALQTLFGWSRKTLAWQNAAPESSFVGQKISIDLTDAESVRVKFIEQNGAAATQDRRNIIYQECPINADGIVIGIGAFSTGKATTIAERKFSVDETGVAFNSAYYRVVDTTTGTTGNDTYVPLAIYKLGGQ